MSGVRRYSVALLGTILCACGFHLKDSRPLAPELTEIYLHVASGYQVIRTRLEESLRTQLIQRGARLVDSDTAPGRLNIFRIQEENRVLSVGPTGKTIEFELLTTVEFDYRHDGSLRVPRQAITIVREYSFDKNRVLAKQAGRLQLREEMHEELADLILLRIDAALLNPPEEVPAAEPAG